MNIWERLANLDRRWYYIVLLVVISWPIIQPWGLPIRIGAEAQAFYRTVESIPAGGRVVLDIEYRTDSVVEMNPMLAAFFRHAARRGIRVITWAGVEEGAMVSQSVMNPIAEELGLTYGEDWINLGYKPGGEVTLQKMIDDFYEAVAYTDISGRRLEEFPIMRGFDSITKADLIVSLVNVTPSPAQTIVKMITIPKGTPLAVGVGSVAVPNEMPFFSSGHYKGLLAGLRGAAEYESLTDNPGSAILGMDAQSAAHLLVIVLIVLGNLGYFLGKRQAVKGGEPA